MSLPGLGCRGAVITGVQVRLLSPRFILRETRLGVGSWLKVREVAGAPGLCPTLGKKCSFVKDSEGEGICPPSWCVSAGLSGVFTLSHLTRRSVSTYVDVDPCAPCFFPFCLSQMVLSQVNESLNSWSPHTPRQQSATYKCHAQTGWLPGGGGPGEIPSGGRVRRPRAAARAGAGTGWTSRCPRGRDSRREQGPDHLAPGPPAGGEGSPRASGASGQREPGAGLARGIRGVRSGSICAGRRRTGPPCPGLRVPSRWPLPGRRGDQSQGW